MWAVERVAEERQAQGLPAVGTFEAVAREWFAVRRDGWSKSYGDKVIARLETDVFPYIGRVPCADITGPQLLEVMRRVESRGVIETAHRALQDSGQVFGYAVATGHAKFNPARELKDALRQPTPKHLPAIVEPKRLDELLRAMYDYAATPVVRAALKLAPMLLLRPGELRYAEWPEIDLDGALWSVPPPPA
ncbi:phage integrase central domain-containing protein [Ideonella sp. A 288]|uniref:tyrosine-type recombinase/integrase n=1 Tax=Ideonella sp. A 288 TaxID=1962181 RepID=UPI001F416400|nr:hypothetical protein [Ideonella sp. A 288]